MSQALAQRRHPVASSEALDVFHWGMHPALYQHIPMAIEIARKVGVLFCIVNFVVVHNLHNLR